MNYVDAISKYQPGLIFECHGDPTIYENIRHIDGPALLSTIALYALYLDDIKHDKIKVLSDECSARISNGFTSDALGTPHYYDSDMYDQINLIGAVTLIAPNPMNPQGGNVDYACRPIVEGVQQTKRYISHDYPTLAKVMYDGAVLVKLQELQKFNQVRDFILNTELTEEEIMSITLDTDINHF